MSEIIIILLLTVLLSIPLGIWIKKVLNREIPWVRQTEDWILNRLHISTEEMGWKKYLAVFWLYQSYPFWFCWLFCWQTGWIWLRPSIPPYPM